MEELLKAAFEAGKDLGHAMANGKPTYGLNFTEWYTNQALRIHDVVGRSEQYHCELYDFGRKDKPCDKQCDGCKAIKLD